MSRPALLDEALEAAGGEDRWLAAERISARVRSGGLLPRTRVPGNRFSDYRLTVEVASPKAILDPFPRAGHRAVFDAGTVSIESSDGEVLRRRQRPREAFSGLSGLRRNLRWDALDATYFGGYAMWNYLVNPLLLTREEVEVTDGDSWSGEGGEWRSLRARFDPELDTHSREQTFWFDRHGLLVRHDYTAEVVAGGAHAAHYCSEHREAGGLRFPTRRRVLPRRRDLRSRPRPTLVALDLSEIEVESSAS
jgi:hypothetical protein